MAEVLNELLHQHDGHSLDIATAYFNVGGWQLLRDGLNGLGNFRLLLGDEPEASSDLGLREIGAKPKSKDGKEVPFKYISYHLIRSYH